MTPEEKEATAEMSKPPPKVSGGYKPVEVHKRNGSRGGRPKGSKNELPSKYKKLKRDKLSQGEIEGITADLAMATPMKVIEDKWDVSHERVAVIKRNNNLNLDGMKEALEHRQITLAMAAQEVALEKVNDMNSYQAAIIAKMSLESAQNIKNGGNTPQLSVNFQEVRFVQDMLRKHGEDVDI